MLGFDSISETSISSLPTQGTEVLFSSTGIINDTVDATLSFVNFSSTGIINDAVASLLTPDILMSSTGIINNTVTSDFKSFSLQDLASLGIVNDTVISQVIVPSELSSTAIITDETISFLVVPKISANIRARFLNNDIKVRL